MNKKPSQPRGSRFERARIARLAAVQAIFQLTTSQTDLNNVLSEFQTHRFISNEYPYPADEALFLNVMQAFESEQNEIQALLSQSQMEGWAVERLDSILAAILRAAIAELLLKNPATAAPVIISEYVDITKGFFNGQEPAYVNKVLDTLAHQFGLAMKK